MQEPVNPRVHSEIYCIWSQASMERASLWNSRHKGVHDILEFLKHLLLVCSFGSLLTNAILIHWLAELCIVEVVIENLEQLPPIKNLKSNIVTAYM